MGQLGLVVTAIVLVAVGCHSESPSADQSATTPTAKTCVFRGTTRVGCVERNLNERLWPVDENCNGEVSERAGRLRLREGGMYYVVAIWLRPGRWQVSQWPGPPRGKKLGTTVKRGARKWDIYDVHSRKIAEAHGTDGPAAATVYLPFREGLCFPIR